jgi:hypothetical protein
MITSVQIVYSLVVVFLPDPQPNFCDYVIDLLNINGYIYLDPRDCGMKLEHNT